jgi:hypothetical protein
MLAGMNTKLVKLACPNVKRYLGRRPAKCGCATCRIKYLEVQLGKALSSLESLERAERDRMEFWL